MSISWLQAYILKGQYQGGSQNSEYNIIKYVQFTFHNVYTIFLNQCPYRFCTDIHCLIPHFHFLPPWNITFFITFNAWKTYKEDFKKHSLWVHNRSREPDEKWKWHYDFFSLRSHRIYRSENRLISLNHCQSKSTKMANIKKCIFLL